ncbi:MAG: 50S ribosomal protein L18 [Bacteroidota bacterium]
MIKKDRYAQRARIKQRIRKIVAGTSERPRLTIYRSLKHIYAQIVDDSAGNTLVAASTRSKELRDKLKATKSPVSASKLVGVSLAQKALERNIDKVVFDRNGYRYHGNVKALADGAREGGLKF